MVISRAQANFQIQLPQVAPALRRFGICRLIALVVWLLVLMTAVYAQSSDLAKPEEKMVLVNGVTDSTVFGIGNSVRITGIVKQGAMSLGGDVIVEGEVDGDVATIGGSVIQLPGSRIGGDVIVIGGTYRAEGTPIYRNPIAQTIMYAGYQEELRDIMRNPTGLFSPHWSPTYFGTRFLVVLFWFIVSLALTAVMPGTISRGVARLQLTSLRVAVIGLIGVVVVFFGVMLSLWIMPEPIRVLIGLLALLLLLVASVFGRVILYAATGRWLQRKYVSFGKNSEAVALLLGTGFWVLLTSLPYVWPFMAAFILIISFGLALTARYRVGWKPV
ncbi:MAG TPA: polymer-forming cytoskeletal protein [Pyrinomonadaceae bacterium]|nr:polymer-forming cytoskeletal protein [Pyrinomonadaceae bacterium]